MPQQVWYTFPEQTAQFASQGQCHPVIPLQSHYFNADEMSSTESTNAGHYRQGLKEGVEGAGEIAGCRKEGRSKMW